MLAHLSIIDLFSYFHVYKEGVIYWSLYVHYTSNVFLLVKEQLHFGFLGLCIPAVSEISFPLVSGCPKIPAYLAVHCSTFPMTEAKRIFYGNFFPS